MIQALADTHLNPSPAGGGRHARIGYRIGMACLGLCGILSVALTEIADSVAAPLAIIIASSLAALLSLLPMRRHSRGVLPHWMITAVSLCGFAWAGYEILVLGASTVLALAHFFSLIVIVKLLDRDGARDNAELLVTSLFLMVIGAIVSGHMVYALLLGIYVWVATHTLFAFHLKCEAERIAGLSGAGPSQSKVFAGAQRAAGDATPGVSGMTVAAVLVLGILVFLLVPRVGVGMLGKLESPVALTLTGFSEDVSFGDLSEIKTSTRPVMRVQLLIADEVIGSPDIQPYYRGVTREVYDGRQWYAARSPETRVRDGSPLLSGYQPGARDGVLEQRIRLLAPATMSLFAAYMPFQIEAEIEADRTIHARSFDRTLALAGSKPPKTLSYVVRSLTRMTPQLAARLNAPDGTLPSWARRLPSANFRAGGRFSLRRVTSKRLRDHVDMLLDDLPLPNDPDGIRAVAERIESYLLSGEFSYTLQRNDVDPKREPVEDFLFHRKRGHCEYFAASMTLMCQLGGINARMVLGYHGGEWNATGRYYIVREEHAHSWVEVHTGEGDWERFDPTPGGVNVEYGDGSIWSTARGIFNHVNAMWADNVVSYNATSRDNLLEAFGSWLTEFGKHGSLAEELYYAAKELLLGPAALKFGYRLLYWTSTALFCLVMYLLFRLARRPARLWWRWIARVAAPKKRRPRREAFYVRTLDLLVEMGFPKKDSSTPLEFMSRLANSDKRFAALPDLARAFYQIHFGGRPLEADQRRNVDRIMAELADSSRLE